MAGKKSGLRQDVERVADETGRVIEKGADRALELMEEGAGAIHRAGKKALRAADKGIKKVGEVVKKEPALRELVDTGTDAVGKVVEKSVEVAKKGIEKGRKLIEE